MLTFKALLQLYGFDPKEVRLVRHAENRLRNDGVTVQNLVIASWRNNPIAFETYQRLQGTEIFGDRKYGAIFLAMPGGKTIFGGIWKVCGVGRNINHLRCDITENDSADLILYDLERIDVLAEYEGRLVIDWGAGTRAWSQLADSKDKRVIAIMDQPDPPFPGWAEFGMTIHEVPTLPPSWQAVLSNARGVYLLLHRKDGQQYVGSAYGIDGFFGRWSEYARSGHGGNVELKGLNPEDLFASVLEVAASSATEADVVRLEVSWKRKLGSRVHGLNSN